MYTAIAVGALLAGFALAAFDDGAAPAVHEIEGKLVVPSPLSAGHEGWLDLAQITAHGDEGDFVGFVRRDGRFVVSGLLPGSSYVIEVAHPTFVFEPSRVEINSQGKVRARKLNHLQPAKVDKMEYPLALRALGKARYFQAREEWRITDMLMSPMVLMMVLPMLLIFLMPKLMGAADPETQKEMQSQMNMLTNPKKGLPDLSEWLAGLSGTSQQSKAVSKKRKEK